MNIKVTPEGMLRRPWKRTLNVSDVWRNDAYSFAERRDVIVGRIKLLPEYAEDEFLEEVADNLAEAEDVEQFDSWWDELYNWADSHRVWIKTW